MVVGWDEWIDRTGLSLLVPAGLPAADARRAVNAWLLLAPAAASERPVDPAAARLYATWRPGPEGGAG